MVEYCPGCGKAHEVGDDPTFKECLDMPDGELLLVSKDGQTIQMVHIDEDVWPPVIL